MEKFKVGIIGLGRIGALLEDEKLREHPCTHLGAFKQSSEFVVEALCDLDLHALMDLGHIWGVPYVSVDYKQMIETHKLDVVSVATPVETHKKIVCDLAESPNSPSLIFVEKPMALSPYEAQQMIDACRMADVTLMVNHTRRWSPVYQAVKQAVDSGKIGNYLFSVGYASREKDFDGNIHMFDVLEWLGQPYVYVDCYPADYLIFELAIFGKTGRINITDNGRMVNYYSTRESLSYEKIKELRLDMNPILQCKDFEVNLWVAVVENIAGVLKGTEKPLCTGEDGLKALEAYTRWKFR